jgi:hypothetical protein
MGEFKYLSEVIGGGNSFGSSRKEFSRGVQDLRNKIILEINKSFQAGLILSFLGW